MDAAQTIATLSLAANGTLTLNGSNALTVTNAISTLSSGRTLNGTGTINASFTGMNGTLGPTSGTLDVNGNITTTSTTGYLDDVTLGTGKNVTIGSTIYYLYVGAGCTVNGDGTTAWSVTGRLMNPSMGSATVNAPITLNSGGYLGYTASSYTLNIGGNVTEASSAIAYLQYVTLTGSSYVSVPSGATLYENTGCTGAGTAAWQITGTLENYTSGSATINAPITLYGTNTAYLGYTSSSYTLNVLGNVTLNSGASAYLRYVTVGNSTCNAAYVNVPGGTTLTDNGYTAGDGSGDSTPWTVAGTLQNNTSSSGTINAPITLSGTLLGYSSAYPLKIGGTVTASGAGGVFKNITFNSGYGAIVPGGTTLTVSGTITGSSTGWTIAGTLQSTTSASITTAPITLAGGALSGGVSYSGAVTATSGTSTISGGTFYSTLTVNSGAALNVNATIAPTAVTVSAGAVLQGTGTINQAISLSGTVTGTLTTGSITCTGGAIAPGNTPGTITINGNLTLDSASALDYSLAPPAT